MPLNDFTSLSENEIDALYGAIDREENLTETVINEDNPYKRPKNPAQEFEKRICKINEQF